MDGNVSVPVIHLEKGIVTPALLPYRMTEGKSVGGAIASTALVKTACLMGH